MDGVTKQAPQRFKPKAEAPGSYKKKYIDGSAIIIKNKNQKSIVVVAINLINLELCTVLFHYFCGLTPRNVLTNSKLSS